MKEGETYEVSEQLAGSLLLGGGWEAPKSREKDLLESAQSRAEDQPSHAERLEAQANAEAEANAEEDEGGGQ